MVQVRRGASAQEVLQSAQHVLFVEGTKEGLDVTVLRALLPMMRVEPLGPSFSVRSVATALHAFHPKYWFIIDRDDWDDATVENSWETFPELNEYNLLIWRRKELESYFLEPDWLCRSRYWRQDKKAEELKQWLTIQGQDRLWLESANRVLISKRNRIKRCRGALFKLGDMQDCNREQVVDKLIASPLLHALNETAASELAEDELRRAFDEEVQRLSDGVIPLEWDRGAWRQLITAKPLFRAMVSQWFRVADRSQGSNALLRGSAAERAVAIDLLKNHQSDMPSDFAELKRMLIERSNEVPRG